MTTKNSTALAIALKAAATRIAHGTAKSAAFGASGLRFRCKRDANAAAIDPWATGTEFLNIGMAGPLAVNAATGAVTLGALSGATIRTAADLSTGISVFHITDATGLIYEQGTIGMAGSGCDLIMTASPTATSGLGISGATILAPSPLPVGATGPADTTAPTVTITTGASPVTVAGGFAITATPADNVGVARVDFFRDGALVGSRTSAPWQVFDTLYYGLNGTHAYTARAYDAANNSALSAAQSVTVNIAAPTETGTPVAIGSAITTATLLNTSASSTTNVPVTFGQVFAVGHLPASGAAVELKKADNSTIAAQLDVKATHPDGSVRHAIISALVPAMAASESIPVSIVRKTATTGATPPTAASFVAAGMNATASIVDAGVTYTATVADLVANATLTPWIAGPIANEWLMHGPLKTAGGVEHPLIHARFYVRAYAGTGKAKIDVTLENTWCIPDPASISGGSAWIWNSPTDVTYDVTVTVPGDTTYTKTALLHYNRARWTKTFWWNGAPPLHIKHSAAYIIASKAVPNYDQSIIPDPVAIAADRTRYLANSAPMQAGLIQQAMGGTGGRGDIGLNPSWAVLYLLSQDKDAKDTMLGTSLLSGSFPVCYRNKGTDLAVDISVNTRACILNGANNDINPVTGKHEQMPLGVSTIRNPNAPDSAHEPNMAYIPYLVTGDVVHLETMHFWSTWNVLDQNPGYRSFGLGYVLHGQIRGAAWCTKNLADVAWISPDGHPEKVRATAALDANLDYLIASHVNGTDPQVANPLGILNNPGMGYPAFGNDTSPISGVTGLISISPWQQDHFTSAMGRCGELGFAKGRTMLNWMAKLQVGRLLGDGFCWQMATMYHLFVTDAPGAALYTTFAQVYAASVVPAVTSKQCGTQAMADAIKANTDLAMGDGSIVINQMCGHSDSDLGYPANLQGALSYVATSDHPQGPDAWLVFSNRAAKPTYTSDAVFAILPRI